MNAFDTPDFVRDRHELAYGKLVDSLARSFGAPAAPVMPTMRWEQGTVSLTIAHDEERGEVAVAYVLRTLPATERAMRSLLEWNLVERRSHVVFTLDPATDEISATLRMPLTAIDGAEEPMGAYILNALLDAVGDAQAGAAS